MNTKSQDRRADYGTGDLSVDKKEYLILFLAAFISITVFSKSSFLYPFNDSVDANCFMTVGRAILKGKVLYADIYEQKGPLLYFIHSLGAWFSPGSFAGIYLIEVIAAFLFLVISFKMLILFHRRHSVILLVPCAFLIYGTNGFRHGDLAEELCLPMLAFGLLAGFRIFEERKLSWKYGLILGVSAGAVLWIKYTMLGLYIGGAIAVLIFMIAEKKVRTLLKIAFEVCLGAGMISVPVLLYFVMHHAMHDLFQVYFYNNMFLYARPKGPSAYTPVSNIVTNVFYDSFFNAILYLMILLGVAGVWIQSYKKALYEVSCLACLCAVTFMGFSQAYYGFALAAFAPLAIVLFPEIPQSAGTGGRRIFAAAGSVVILLGSVRFSSYNTYLLFARKDNMPQFVFAKEINRVKNPTLLNYGFLDGGFYMASGVLPVNKYFAKLNIPLKAMGKDQRNTVLKKKVKFVVTRNLKLQAGGYRLIDTARYPFGEETEKYYLYKRM